MRVLIVRLSSMGDMMHTLPAVTDAARVVPDLKIDWVVDRAFAEIPAWHHAVRDVIAGPPRRLSNLWTPDFKKFFSHLRSSHYDLVIDIQGHWKTAITAHFAKGIHCGYDRKSVNEWGAHVLYNKKFFVTRQQHSIQRMRELMASALNYSFDAQSIDYGIDRSRLPGNPLQIHGPYLVFVHSTSWESKCWMVEHWQALVTKSIRSGFHVALPWGNEAEKRRAQRIAGNHAEAIVLPKLSISEKASVLAGAIGSVGLDTGLSHIAAALDVPSVTLYGPTDPFFIGATGKNQVHLASDFECVKCHRSTCDYSRKVVPKPACLSGLTPEKIWSSLEALLLSQTGSKN